MAVLYGNDAYSSFLKKVFVQNFHCLSHKIMPIPLTEGYFENPQYRCLEEYMLFLLALKWNL